MESVIRRYCLSKYCSMAITGHNSPCQRQMLIPATYLRVLAFVLCVQLARTSALSSINSTISKTQISEKEDLERFANGLSSDVSPRRNLPRCGGIYTVRPYDLAFRIYSPDYPLPYPSLANCIYDIRFQGGSFPCFLDLHFEDFFMSSVLPDCIGDRLEVGGQRFCGGLSGVQRFETEWGRNGERHLLLRMVTDEVGTGRGFRICVSQVPCNGPLPVPPQYPLYPPITQPPIVRPLPTSPPYYPPWLPPFNPPPPPHHHHHRPPPSYSPPLFFPLCCGTQHQGHHIHLISPGFPAQLPGIAQCGYVINRLNPRVTQLRIHFKYFFLPCPWDPYQYGGASPYPASARGYFNIDNRNICGCQTGLIITVPFGISETRKVLRFYNPSIIPLSRSQKDSAFSSENYNESSISSSGEAPLQFKASLNDLTHGKYQNVQLINERTLGAAESIRALPSSDFSNSQLILFPSPSSVTDSAVGGDTQRLTEKNLTNREGNSTSDPVSKSGRAFDSFLYNRPNIRPPLGFLLEVIQEEIPFYPSWRRNDFNRVGNADTSLAGKLKALSSSSVQNASSRFFHSQSRSCQVNDWPQVKWWLIWLRTKNLLQVCPARVPPSPRPPFIPPPFCNEPFIPISR